MAAAGEESPSHVPPVVRKDESDEEDLEEAAASAQPIAPGDYQARAAALWCDPKMVTLKSYMQSHKREDRRLFALSQSPSAPDLSRTSTSLRTNGCLDVDRRIKSLSQQELAPARYRPRREPGSVQFGLGKRSASASTFETERPYDPELSQSKLRQSSRVHIQHQFGGSLDKTMKSLFVDMELARDDSLRGKVDHSSEMCCKHVDKVYDWFTPLSVKSTKPRKSPAMAHIRFSEDESVFPGSLRVAPQSRRAGGGRPVGGEATRPDTGDANPCAATGDASPTGDSEALPAND